MQLVPGDDRVVRHICIRCIVLFLRPKLVYTVFLEVASEEEIIAAAASEPEANERGSSLISRRLLYRGLQSIFLTKRKELWLCASGRFSMRSGMLQGIVVIREWEDLGCAAYQSHV